MCSRIAFVYRIINKYIPKWKFSKNDRDTSETLRCLWPIFRWARIFGMCPVSRVGNQIIVQKRYHITWFTTWIAVCVSSIMWINTIIGTFPFPSDSLGICWTINNLTYYSQILAACVYMAIHTKYIPEFLDRCIKVEEICKSYLVEEKKTTGLMRDTFLLFLSFESAQFFGVVLYHTGIAASYDRETFIEYLDIYSDSYNLIQGSRGAAFLYLFSLVYVDYAWHFPDLLMAMFSLMLGRLFARINRVLAKADTLSLIQMEKLRCDHREICKLVRVCNDIFSPLFFTMYIGNIIYLFTRLFTALGSDLKDSKQIVHLEALYAFSYLIFVKIILPTYLAARLHERAHESLDTLHGWPTLTNAADTREKLLVMGRFISHMSTGDIAISGCGFFTITKRFLVTLFGALITYEVFILQFQAKELHSN